MVKTDLRAEDVLHWDEYKDKTLDEALPSIYQRACTACETFPGWYWHSIRTKRRTSLVVRLLTFAMVIAGTLAPILAGLYGPPEERLTLTQLGVCALALGGLLQLADRVFGWSSGWLRYIRTATAMESRARQFQLDWAGYIIDRSGKLSDADVKPLFDMAAELQKALMTLQSEETDAWVTEFNTGANLLSDIIKSQRESTEAAAKAARAALAAHTASRSADAAAQLPGAIELTLEHTAAPLPLAIRLDDETPKRFLGTVWARTAVAPGQHVVTIETTDKPPRLTSRIVEVPAGGVATLTVPIGT